MGLATPPPRTRGCRVPGSRALHAGLRTDLGPRRWALPVRCTRTRRHRDPRRARRRRAGRDHRSRLGRHGDLRGGERRTRAVVQGGRRSRAAGRCHGVRFPPVRPTPAELVHVLLPEPDGRARRPDERSRVHRPAVGGLVARSRRLRRPAPRQGLPRRPGQPQRCAGLLPRHPRRRLQGSRHSTGCRPPRARPPRNRPSICMAEATDAWVSSWPREPARS